MRGQWSDSSPFARTTLPERTAVCVLVSTSSSSADISRLPGIGGGRPGPAIGELCVARGAGEVCPREGRVSKRHGAIATPIANDPRASVFIFAITLVLLRAWGGR